MPVEMQHTATERSPFSTHRVSVARYALHTTPYTSMYTPIDTHTYTHTHTSAHTYLHIHTLVVPGELVPVLPYRSHGVHDALARQLEGRSHHSVPAGVPTGEAPMLVNATKRNEKNHCACMCGCIPRVAMTKLSTRFLELPAPCSCWRV